MKVKKTLGIVLSAILSVSFLAMPASAAAGTSAKAEPLKSPVTVDGTEVAFDAWSINGSGYFRLRDIAYALKGTAKQFQVSYNIAEELFELKSDTPYLPIGREMATDSPAQDPAVLPAVCNATLDGEKITLTAYSIGAYFYIRLFDLAAAMDFCVSVPPGGGDIAIDTSSGYKVPLGELAVTMIGDSIGTGVGPYVKKLLPRLENHSKGSRQFSQAKGVVQELLKKGQLAKVVVIQLGTNGKIRDTDMRALIDLIGGGRKIVFVNCQIPRSWGTIDNETIAKVTAEYDNTVIADWYAASLNQDGYFAGDHVHLTVAGDKALAAVIAGAVEKIQ
jgi:lysophospholipase L1-like esterase